MIAPDCWLVWQEFTSMLGYTKKLYVYRNLNQMSVC